MQLLPGSGGGKKAVTGTAVLTAVGVLLFLQFTAFSFFMDLVSSTMIFGIGYLACWLNKK